MLGLLILGDSGTADRGPRCSVVVQRRPVGSSVDSLRRAVAQARAGDCVAYGIPLDTPLMQRLLTLVTIRFQLRRVERDIVRVGGRVVARYGVDPSLDDPSCLFELESPASEYAARCLRPRGSAPGVRRLLARCFGCDPALGGVVVVGQKP